MRGLTPAERARPVIDHLDAYEQGTDQAIAELPDREELQALMAAMPGRCALWLSTLRAWGKARDNRALSIEEYGAFADRLGVAAENLDWWLAHPSREEK